MTHKGTTPPTEPAKPKRQKLTKEKSEAIAGFLAGILRDCDLLLGASRFGVIEYLEQFQEEARSRQYVQKCLAYNQLKDDKLDLEMETLDAILALLRVRKQQVEGMRTLKTEEDSAKEFQDFISSLI